MTAGEVAVGFSGIRVLRKSKNLLIPPCLPNLASFRARSMCSLASLLCVP